jgi:hypothetical protein
MAQSLPDFQDRPVATLVERVVCQHPSNWATKAELTGFSDRQLRKWRRNEWRCTQLWACDRILAALGSSDPTAQYLTSVGLSRFVGGGAHEFLAGMVEQALPAVIEAERAGVRMHRAHGANAGKMLEERLNDAIERANRILD